MKTNETTVLRIVQTIVDKLGVDPSRVEYKASFSDDLGADSLDVYELLMTLEKEFRFTIEEDEAEKLTTVGSVIEFVDTKLTNKPVHHQQKIKSEEPKQTEIILMNHLKRDSGTNNFSQIAGY